jgi:RNA polymerase sigma-70 factor (ECF subfamily)
VRKLASRARRNVQAARPRFPVERDVGQRLAEAFYIAAISGDTTTLRSILARDVVIHSDGGGKIHAFPNPIFGLEKVLRLYEGLLRKLKGRGEFIRLTRIDGLPGYISRERDGVLQTTAFAIEDGRIAEVFITRNPEKLRHVAKLIEPLSRPH